MKKQLLLTIFMALLACKALAQDGYTIKVGGNYASFRALESDLDLGFALGIGHEWKISKRMCLALELMYTAKKTVIRNKTVAYEIYWFSGDALDIYSDIRYLKIPLMWKYCLPIGKNLLIELYAGASLDLAIKDRSKAKRLYTIYTPQRDFKYDYTFARDADPLWLGSSGINVNGGMAIGWSVFTVELRYSRALHDVDVISGIAMNEKLDSLQLLIGLKF